MSKDVRLLFVNYDGANYNSKDHRAQVNSFVQRGPKRGKEERLQKLKASTAKLQHSWRLRGPQQVIAQPGPQKPQVEDEPQEGHHADSSEIIEDGCEPPASKAVVQVWKGSDARILSDPMCMSALQEQLDPFIRLAGKTTRTERNLLHHYFTVIPAAVYGSSSSALYCPVRDITVANMQSNHLWLQWVLLSAEKFIMGLEAADKDKIHLARKRYLYRSMQNIVSDGTTRYSDNTITALSFGGLIEARAGELEKGRKHLIASKALISARGGIQSIPIALSFPVLTTMLWLGTGTGAFSNSHAVEVAIQKFKAGIFQLQQCPRLVPKLANSPAYTASYEVYLDARDLALGSLSPIRRFIEPVHCDPSLSQQRSHSAILWVLNMMICEQQQDWRASARFLNSFYRYIESSGGENPSNLKAWTVVLTLGFCGARFDSESGKNADDSVLRWWDAVDVVELLQFVSQQRRDQVLRFLSQCLLWEEDLAIITKVQMDQLASEMRLKWLESKYG